MSGAYTPPNNTVGIDDIFAINKGFGGDPTAPPMAWIDVEPECPNKLINLNDILVVQAAFGGASYPFRSPRNCDIDTIVCAP